MDINYKTPDEKNDIEYYDDDFVSELSSLTVTFSFVLYFVLFGIVIPIMLIKHNLYNILELYLPNLDLIANVITFNSAMTFSAGINDNSQNSAQWNTDLTFRWALGAFSRTSIATRINYQQSFGDFEFFQASNLDGFNTLRGFRRYRFSGESSFSHQIDLKVDLFEWNNYFLPSKVGLILFNDLGRVWVDGEDSNTLHHGYGGGFYLTPFGSFAINILMAKSEEAFLPLLKFGFYF